MSSRPPGSVVPVYDDHGTVIAYWAEDVGWITLAEHDAPGFSYEKAMATYRARTAARTGCPVVTLDECMAQRLGIASAQR